MNHGPLLLASVTYAAAAAIAFFVFHDWFAYVCACICAGLSFGTFVAYRRFTKADRAKTDIEIQRDEALEQFIREW